MEKIRLGRTELMVSRSGFGAIPIQRLSFEDAGKLLRHAYDGGINFFDTARSYTDSEEKIGQALSGVRENIVIATKSPSHTKAEMLKDLETSLRNLKTDYIDIYQFHNPPFIPFENHEIYQAALEAKRAGKIRFISITSHQVDMAIDMVKSGLFDTMQFPLSSLSDEKDFKLAELCRELDVGVIAMKAMSGGLLTDPTASFALLREKKNIVPIWGIQHDWELEQFLKLEENPPSLSDELKMQIAKDKAELSGNFCRACGYCMPSCPAKIEIATAARMSLLLRRTNPAKFLLPESKTMMDRVNDCIDCGVCKTHCPYKLDTPNLLRREYSFYKEYLHKHEA
jgi:aryl-alcohol dehydrogenase-like predicted oxidoreductase/NAD-dependent dihydropyrimidine dehydrogenase PreA subunit